MTTYAATQVGAYLKARFQFTFSDEEILQRLEDHIWEAGRRAQTQRRDIERTCHALADDIRYVLTSTEKQDRAPYVPNQRGDFAAAVALCGELEREVQDLVGVHQAILSALREHLSQTPTLEEHTQALGELRMARAHLGQAQHQVTELLAARDEWASDEAELLRRLDEAEKQGKDYAARLKGTDVATTLRIKELEDKLEAETRAAETFHDERDAEAEHVQRYRAEIERLEGLQIQDANRIQDLEAKLANAQDRPWQNG
jgi:chromosome segregation ATPase